MRGCNGRRTAAENQARAPLPPPSPEEDSEGMVSPAPNRASQASTTIRALVDSAHTRKVLLNPAPRVGSKDQFGELADVVLMHSALVAHCVLDELLADPTRTVGPRPMGFLVASSHGSVALPCKENSRGMQCNLRRNVRRFRTHCASPSSSTRPGRGTCSTKGS